MQPSPNGRRVGIRIVTFEARSSFTHVTARRIAQPPKAAFVTRLQPLRLPARTARQLPDQSTTLRVESSSTGNPRLRGALPQADIRLNFTCDKLNGRLANRLYGGRPASRQAFAKGSASTAGSARPAQNPPALKEGSNDNTCTVSAFASSNLPKPDEGSHQQAVR